MAIYGRIVRTTPAESSGADITAKPYSAHRNDGTFIGTFASFRDAQAPINAASGYTLKWVDESANGVEAYRGEYP